MGSFLKGGSMNESFFERTMNSMRQISISTILIIVGIIILLSISIYYYYNHVVTSSTTYKHNSEGSQGNGKNKKAELMLFYVDWCPHCKTAKPEWEEIKAQYDGKTINGYHVIFTEINCTEETAEIEKMVDKYKIEGYPTIKLLKDGQVIEFDAKPTKSTLDQFLNTVL